VFEEEEGESKKNW